MTSLVTSDARRREVCAEVGLSYGKLRTLRRVAKQSLTMGELANILVVDPPNLTALVDDLERRGLVKRHVHPSDRRAKLVTATRSGIALAARAEQLLDQPPDEIGALGVEELETLRRILLQVQLTAEEPVKVSGSRST